MPCRAKGRAAQMGWMDAAAQTDSSGEYTRAGEAGRGAAVVGAANCDLCDSLWLFCERFSRDLARRRPGGRDSIVYRRRHVDCAALGGTGCADADRRKEPVRALRGVNAPETERDTDRNEDYTHVSDAVWKRNRSGRHGTCSAGNALDCGGDSDTC